MLAPPPPIVFDLESAECDSSAHALAACHRTGRSKQSAQQKANINTQMSKWAEYVKHTFAQWISFIVYANTAQFLNCGHSLREQITWMRRKKSFTLYGQLYRRPFCWAIDTASIRFNSMRKRYCSADEVRNWCVYRIQISGEFHFQQRKHNNKIKNKCIRRGADSHIADAATD